MMQKLRIKTKKIISYFSLRTVKNLGAEILGFPINHMLYIWSGLFPQASDLVLSHCFLDSLPLMFITRISTLKLSSRILFERLYAFIFIIFFLGLGNIHIGKNWGLEFSGNISFQLLLCLQPRVIKLHGIQLVSEDKE